MPAFYIMWLPEPKRLHALPAAVYQQLLLLSGIGNALDFGPKPRKSMLTGCRQSVGYGVEVFESYGVRTQQPA